MLYILMNINIVINSPEIRNPIYHKTSKCYTEGYSFSSDVKVSIINLQMRPRPFAKIQHETFTSHWTFIEPYIHLSNFSMISDWTVWTSYQQKRAKLTVFFFSNSRSRDTLNLRHYKDYHNFTDEVEKLLRKLTPLKTQIFWNTAVRLDFNTFKMKYRR